MAIIKCKMCGGNLHVEEGSTVCECEYCGTRQTVPSADNEKKLTLFNRAGRLLRACEFDKAAGVFETIVADFPEEAEAYWGLVLCKYGIEYVDDPATGKKIPTCHRTLLSSIMDDSDFDLACENADAIARRLYRDEAKSIDSIQQGILRIVESEETYDVFICYKELDENGSRTEDSVLAQEIYDSLTAKGLKVFFARITLEDKLGEEFEPYIYAALHSAKVMLAIGTSYEYFDSVWVKNEWARFLGMIKTDSGKKLIPCFKGIDAYDMPREFKNLLAQDMGKLGWLQDLTRGVIKICGKEEGHRKETTIVQQVIQEKSQSVDNLLKRAFSFLEDGIWHKAAEYADRVLDLDMENGNAYLVKLMVAYNVRKENELADLKLSFKNNSNWNKIQRYGDQELLEKLDSYHQTIIDRIENNLITEIEKALNVVSTEKGIASIKEKAARVINDEKRRELLNKVEQKIQEIQEENKRQEELEEEKRRIEEEEHRKNVAAIIKMRPERIKYLEYASGLIGASYAGFAYVKADGTVVSYSQYGNTGGDWDPGDTSRFRDVKSVVCTEDGIVGLLYDGTCVSTKPCKWCDSHITECNEWKSIIAISAGSHHVVGLKEDGTCVANTIKWNTGYGYDGQSDVKEWRDIASVACGWNFSIGLKKDGSVVYTGVKDNTPLPTVEDWKNMEMVAAAGHSVVGLTNDGKILCINAYADGIDPEKGIVQMMVVQGQVYALYVDGTVGGGGKSSANRISFPIINDNNIISIVGRPYEIYALTEDGRIMIYCYSWNRYGVPKDIQIFNSYKQIMSDRLAEEENKRKENAAKQKLYAERKSKGVCLYCGGTFKKSLISEKCVSCGRKKDY